MWASGEGNRRRSSARGTLLVNHRRVEHASPTMLDGHHCYCCCCGRGGARRGCSHAVVRGGCKDARRTKAARSGALHAGNGPPRQLTRTTAPTAMRCRSGRARERTGRNSQRAGLRPPRSPSTRGGTGAGAARQVAARAERVSCWTARTEWSTRGDARKAWSAPAASPAAAAAAAAAGGRAGRRAARVTDDRWGGQIRPLVKVASRAHTSRLSP